MVDGERKKAAKAGAEAADAVEAEQGRSREALRALQQQMQVGPTTGAMICACRCGLDICNEICKHLQEAVMQNGCSPGTPQPA